VLITTCRLERVLNFSRNNAVDIEDADVLSSTQIKLAKAYESHCWAAGMSASDLGYAEDVLDQCRSATGQAGAFKRQILPDAKKLATRIKNRATREPLTGQCDAILVTPISVSVIRSNPGVAQYLDKSNLLLHTNSTIVKNEEAQGTAPSTSNALLTLPSTSTRSVSPSPSQQSKIVDPLGPFQVSCTESRTASDPENIGDSDSLAINRNDLLLPGCVVEYKKMDETETKALNQARMYLVSAVTFLSALGITGYPVFGLVTSGKTGGVILAWYSKEQDVCDQPDFIDIII
jgi:hypothetical protein